MEFEFIEHMGGLDMRMFLVTIYRRQTHFHGDIEIVLPLEGSVLVDVANKRSLVETGDFFIVNRDEAHSLARTNENNLLLVLQFSPGFARDYYPQLSRILIRQRHVMRKWMPKLHAELKVNFARMLRLIGEKSEGYPLALMSALNAIACAIIRHGVYEMPAAGRPAGEEKARARLTAIVDYIQKNYTGNLSLAELSKAEGLDMAYLSHFIKKQLGISFREYVNRLRLERAVDLIVNTRIRMIDVCVECGYSDHRYLNRAVASAFGVTPAQLRKQGFAVRAPIFSDQQAESDGEHRFEDLDAVYRMVCRGLESEE